MTNHPRSQRPKFKVGQVVFDRRYAEYIRLVEFDRHGEKPAWYTSAGYSIEEQLRPLTKKEAGR